MMFSLTLKALLVFTAFIPPQLFVNWTGGSQESVTVYVDKYDPQLERCAKGGLDVRYRFEMRICRKRSLWLDSCGSRHYQIRTMQYDPISQLYSISSDTLGDELAPKVIKMTSFSEAMKYMGEVKSLQLKSMDNEGTLLNNENHVFLRVQLLADCRGAHSHLAERFSNVLSLGMVRSSGFDSGLIDFDIGR